MDKGRWIVRYFRNGAVITHPWTFTHLRDAQGASRELVRDRVAIRTWVETVR